CLTTREVKDALLRLDVPPDEFREKLETALREPRPAAEKAAADVRLKDAERLVALAARAAILAHAPAIRTADIFAALAEFGDPALDQIFVAFGMNAKELRQALLFASMREALHGFRRLPGSVGGIRHGIERGGRHRIMNRAWTSRPTPTLDRVSSDLTALARAGASGFLVGHETEYRRMMDALARPVNSNALLVGDPGIGKETIVQRLAFALIADDVPAPLFDKRLVMIELAGLVAGAEPAELQKRLTTIIREIEIAGNIILYIPEAHNLLRTSGAAQLSAADALMPIILGSAFPVVGSTYPREFKQLVEPRSDFVGAFDVIHVDEVTEEEAVQVLIAHALLLEG
ncbi:MAG: hypothetical protein AAB867_01555, partial [Patescibacteria group bacterium]